MLQAAKRILERDGIPGLTLRAAARQAGVSHAAPKNHFGDLRGLLSELAAVGFERFRTAMLSKLCDGGPPAARMDAIGHGYVAWRAEAATLGRSCGYIEGSLDLINAIVLATLYDPRARPSATRLWISGILCAGAAGHALHQFVVLLRRR